MYVINLTSLILKHDELARRASGPTRNLEIDWIQWVVKGP